jgi:hypothetical protein
LTHSELKQLYQMLSLHSKGKVGRDNLPFLFGRALYTKEGWIVLSDNVKYTVSNFDELNVLDNHDTDVLFIESFDAHYLLPFGSSDRVCVVKT